MCLLDGASDNARNRVGGRSQGTEARLKLIKEATGWHRGFLSWLRHVRLAVIGTKGSAVGGAGQGMSQVSHCKRAWAGLAYMAVFWGMRRVRAVGGIEGWAVSEEWLVLAWPDLDCW